MSQKKRVSRPFGRRAALLVIDVQNDYLAPNGALAVAGGRAVIPVINNLRDKVGWDTIILSQDWHQKDHCSFLSTQLAKGLNAEKFVPLQMADGTMQMMWPDHCVQNTEGAKIHADLITEASDHIVKKGKSVDADSYSAFADKDGANITPMTKILKQAHVTDVYVTGLANDYCVGSTALDAVAAGFTTYLVEDATASVDLQTHKSMKIQLEKAGVTTITSKVIVQQLEQTDDRRQQAADYMEENNIPLLIQKLCTSLVFHKPVEPKSFLIKELQKLQKQRRSELSKLSLLTDEDLDTMFHMLDPIGQGVLDARQVVKALAGLGLRPSTEIKDSDTFNASKFKQLVLAAS